MKKSGVGRPAGGAGKLTTTAILEDALQLLDEEGHEAVTFRALALRLGVTPMAINYRVGTRQELFEHLVSRVYADIGQEPSGGTPVEKIQTMMEQYCECAIAHPNLVHCILSDMSLLSEQLVSLTELVRENISLLGVKEPKIDTLIGVIVDYTHGFSFSAAAYTAADAKRNGGIGALTLGDYREGLCWILGRVAES